MRSNECSRCNGTDSIVNVRTSGGPEDEGGAKALCPISSLQDVDLQELADKHNLTYGKSPLESGNLLLSDQPYNALCVS